MMTASQPNEIPAPTTETPPATSQQITSVWHSYLVIGIVAVALLIADQYTKQLAISHLKFQAGYSWLWDTARLQYAENTGGFLSLGGNLDQATRFWLLTVFNGLILVGCGVGLVMTKRSALIRWGLGLVLSGGIGNLIDRVVYEGVVIDFMNLGIGPLRTGIFNIADIAISAGVILMIWQHYLNGKQLEAQTRKNEA